MITINRNNPTAGEITSSLTNSTDAAGLHFDGAAGNIDLGTPPDLGTKFSMEFIVQADSVSGSDDTMFVDFGTGGRFIFGINYVDDEISIYDSASWKAFGVLVLDDLKPHHLVATIDGTAAILYDNGNQVGTATISAGHNIDLCTDAKIGSRFGGAANFFNGTIYRARFWNKTLTAAEVTASFENSTVPFSDQYGSQTIVIPGDFTGNLDGWDTYNDWNSQTNPSNNMVLAASASPTTQVCRNSVSLIAGKRYRVDYTASSVTGAPTFSSYDSGVYTTQHTITNGTRSFEMIWPVGNSVDFLYITNADSATAAVTLDDISVREIGCVSDYDLAFANQKQSLVVEDRSGSSDTGVNATGMMSASGVTQCTPIEQLNSKSARIGTSAATPADGELVVSKVVAGATGLLGLYDNNVRSTGAGVLSVGTAGAGDIQFYRGDVNHTKLSATGLEVTGAVTATTLSTFSAGIAVNDTSGNYGGKIVSASDVAGTATLSAVNTATTGTRRLTDFFAGTSTTRIGSIETDGSATAFNTSSDYRLKENVTELTGALDRLDSIPVYNFNFKANPTKTVDGFLAHEVAEFVPEAISGEKDEMETVVVTKAVEAVEAVAATLYVEGDELPEGKSIGDEKTPAVEAVDAVAEVTEEQPKYQGIDQSKLVPLMLAAIKELKAKVNALENA